MSPWIGGAGLVLYSSFILYISSLPQSSLPHISISDKLAHFFIYFILGIIFANFLNSLKKPGVFLLVGATLLFVTLYGTLNEIYQALIPGRSFDELDILANIIGGAFGGSAYLVVNYLVLGNSVVGNRQR